MLNTSYYPDDARGFGGEILVVDMEIEDQEFILLNEARHLNLTSRYLFPSKPIHRKRLTTIGKTLQQGGGEESQCGWVKDKFGLSWQISPAILRHLLQEKDAHRAKGVMDAMMKMSKIIIKDLEETAKE